MGKTFRKDSPFRPKKQGKTFVKDPKPWKKNKHRPVENNPPPIDTTEELE